MKAVEDMKPEDMKADMKAVDARLGCSGQCLTYFYELHKSFSKINTSHEVRSHTNFHCLNTQSGTKNKMVVTCIYRCTVWKRKACHNSVVQFGQTTPIRLINDSQILFLNVLFR